MPYICLAQGGIADGTVNILDLFPNESQRNLIYDVIGQTRYVNRAQNELPVIDAAGQVLFTVNGLSAYLAARVEPAGAEFAEATITVVGATAGDTVTIGGIDFLCVAGGADASAQEFNDVANSGSAALSGLSLQSAIQNAASQTLIENANDGVSVDVASQGNVLTLTATEPGAAGELTLATSAPARFTLSAATLERTTDSTWTRANLQAASAAILARLDAGSSLTLSDVNTILDTYGAELTNAGGSNSAGTLRELLSILAGRGFRLPAGSLLLDGTDWQVDQGKFTTSVTVFDPDVVTEAGGLVVERENKPVRNTYEGGSLNVSLLLGSLSVFASGVTLYPTTQRHTTAAPSFATVTGARLVTVYADDGSVLA